MKPPKRLRNPPKKGFQQKISTSKRQKTTPRRNGQSTTVPHGENVPIASDTGASHNDTRPTDRPLYDVASLSTPSTYGPSTSTVQQRPQQPANSLPIPGQETQGAENNNLGMLQHSSPQGMGNFVNSFEGRLQVGQSPSNISSFFYPISSHIPVKIKDKIWKGEFIDLNLFLKSAKDLVNDPSLEGELAIKGGIFTVVNKKKHSINNIHVWTSAFMIYASVMLEKFPNNGQEYLYANSQNGSF